MEASEKHKLKLEVATQLHAGLLANPNIKFGFTKIGKDETGTATINAGGIEYSSSQMALDQAAILLERWDANY
jgi:hypothetical protein